MIKVGTLIYSSEDNTSTIVTSMDNKYSYCYHIFEDYHSNDKLEHIYLSEFIKDCILTDIFEDAFK